MRSIHYAFSRALDWAYDHDVEFFLAVVATYLVVSLVV